MTARSKIDGKEVEYDERTKTWKPSVINSYLYVEIEKKRVDWGNVGFVVGLSMLVLFPLSMLAIVFSLPSTLNIPPYVLGIIYAICFIVWAAFTYRMKRDFDFIETYKTTQKVKRVNYYKNPPYTSIEESVR